MLRSRDARPVEPDSVNTGVGNYCDNSDCHCVPYTNPGFPIKHSDTNTI